MADDLFAELLPAVQSSHRRRGGAAARLDRQQPFIGVSERQPFIGVPERQPFIGVPERHYRAARRLARGMSQQRDDCARLVTGRRVCEQIRAMLDAQARLAEPLANG